MIVWGGEGYDSSNVPVGGQYDPTSDAWAPTTVIGAPVPLVEQTAVWTGTRMIVWGGSDGLLFVNDGGQYLPEGSASAPPVAKAGADLAVECAGPAGTAVQQHGAAIGCGALTLTWTGPFPEGGGSIQGSDPVVTLSLGASTITLTVQDAQGQSATDSMIASVHDTTPPTFTVQASPSVLWPPNHQMIPVSLAFQVQDRCDPNPAVTLISATSSEPDDAPGQGDGNTPGDIAGADIGTPDVSVSLRAERDAGGPGRVYRLEYRAVDASGNSTTALAFVTVPHDQGGGPEPLLMQLQPDATPGMVRIDWPAIEGALGYDVISGDLSQATVVNHVLSLDGVRVLARGTTATSLDEGSGGAIPPVGTAILYFIQARTNAGGLGYGTESAPWPRVPGACDGGCP
jgi:hypothetical protein